MLMGFDIFEISLVVDSHLSQTSENGAIWMMGYQTHSLFPIHYIESSEAHSDQTEAQCWP